jgi:hypothetical protein
MVDGPISISILLPKTPGHRARHEARSNHQGKVPVSDEQTHANLPIFTNKTLIHSSTLFKKLKVNNAFVIKKNK